MRAEEPVDGGVQVPVAGAGSGSLGAFDGFAWSERLPWACQPPPSGIRPTFVTSTCTISAWVVLLVLPSESCPLRSTHAPPGVYNVMTRNN